MDTDVIRDEVIRNTNELNHARTNLSGRIDNVASKQDMNAALLSQQRENIGNLGNEFGALKSCQTGQTLVALFECLVAVLEIFVLVVLYCCRKKIECCRKK